MGKTRDLFKKVRDTKGTFHAKMSTIKDRDGMDLTTAEDIKKRWQEYTEDYIKQIFMTQQSHCWAHTPRKPELKETHVPQCSLQHCL